MFESDKRQLSWSAMLICFVAFVLAIAMIAAPGNAATYTYADAVRTDASQWRQSPRVTGLTGGSTGLSGIGPLASLRIESYIPHPGFDVYASATGAAPGSVYLTHAPVNGYRSRCMWHYPGGGGTAEVDLTCRFTY